jgi:hypothetical protein
MTHDKFSHAIVARPTRGENTTVSIPLSDVTKIPTPSSETGISITSLFVQKVQLEICAVLETLLFVLIARVLVACSAQFARGLHLVCYVACSAQFARGLHLVCYVACHWRDGDTIVNCSASKNSRPPPKPWAVLWLVKSRSRGMIAGFWLDDTTAYFSRGHRLFGVQYLATDDCFVQGGSKFELFHSTSCATSREQTNCYYHSETGN